MSSVPRSSFNFPREISVEFVRENGSWEKGGCDQEADRALRLGITLVRTEGCTTTDEDVVFTTYQLDLCNSKLFRDARQNKSRLCVWF